MTPCALAPKAGPPRQGYEFIYALRCPDTNAVRYVGRTSISLRARLTNHMGMLKASKRPNKQLTAWKQGLLEQGKCPTISLLAVVSIDFANNAERKWTRHYQKIGGLLNMRNVLVNTRVYDYDLWQLNDIADHHGLDPDEVATAANVCRATCSGMLAGVKTPPRGVADAIAKFLYSLPPERVFSDIRSRIHNYAAYFLDDYLKQLYSR